MLCLFERVKMVTRMTEKVATGVLSGVVKVSGFFTGSVANSKVGKKFFGLLPGEMVLASLDGFSTLITLIYSYSISNFFFGWFAYAHRKLHLIESNMTNTAQTSCK